MSISQSLQKDIWLAKKSRRCIDKYGGHDYVGAKPFQRSGIWRVKCRRCRQDLIIIESELANYGWRPTVKWD